MKLDETFDLFVSYANLDFPVLYASRSVSKEINGPKENLQPL